MIYTTMTVAAMKLAYEAHQGQMDKGGLPYIFHPFLVAEQMEDEIGCTAALLHDVVEDTFVTMQELEKLFPAEVIAVLRVLTHDKDIPYMDYIAEVAKDPVARRVKLADIAHNDSQERTDACGMIAPETRERLHQKYTQAREYLLSHP